MNNDDKMTEIELALNGMSELMDLNMKTVVSLIETVATKLNDKGTDKLLNEILGEYVADAESVISKYQGLAAKESGQ